jgi:hypothetical protein
LDSEPVSPELVLVDPELAQRERARLSERARLEERLREQRLREAEMVRRESTEGRATQVDIDIGALRRAVERSTAAPPPTGAKLAWKATADHLRKRVMVAVLMCSLLVNGVVLADVVGRTDDSVPAVAPPVTVTVGPLAQSVASSPSSPQPTSSVSTTPARTVEATRASVERKLIAQILASPAGKLPRIFLDERTGLVKNNVHVVCSAATRSSFICTVRLAGNSGRVVTVRYRTTRDGKGTFKWPSVRS